MAKEILLYSDIYGWTAERAIMELNEARNSPEVAVRFNGDGGEIRYGWAVIGKTKEIKGKKVFKNDGEANSMYAFAFCYNDNNEALDTSYFKFHRASWGLAYEKEFMTDQERTELVDKNAKLRSAMESKIDVPVFTRLKNVTLDQLFDMNDRVEVCLTADEAFQCKLINRVVPITPEYSEQIRVLTAHFSPNKIAAKSDPPSIPTNMTKDEIKSKFPETYKQIFAAGVKRGVEKEFERVSTIAVHAETDPKKVLEAINSRKPLTPADQTSLLMKGITAMAAKTLEAESAETIQTDGKTAAGEKPTPAAEAKKKAEEEAGKKALDAEFKKMYPNSKKAA